MAVTFCNSCGNNIKIPCKFCPECGKPLQVKWWFTKCPDDPKKLTLCLDGKPFCTSKEKSPPCVAKVEALSPRHVQVVFKDDTTHDLALVFFDGDKDDFQHSLKASMDSERFAEQFAEDLKALTNTSTGHWQRNLLFAAIGAPLAVGAAVVALPVIGFGAAGITAGSYAAGMMSAAAVANGGAVAAGGLVATLQAAGAVGLGVGATAAVGAAGGAAAAAGSAAVGAVQDKLRE